MKNLFQGFFLNRREAFLQVALIFGSLILLNYLSDAIILRFDLTEDKQYTLSKASKDIAADVEDPITVKAYFSKNLPPQLAVAEQEFRSFLEEFKVYAGGNIEFEFINPNESEELEQSTQQAGIQPFLIDVRERDQVTQKRAYLGAVFTYDERKEVIPVIQPGAAMEFAIASTVKKLTNAVKSKIGLLQGNGEPTLQEMPQLQGELSQMYDIVEVGGLDTTGVVNPEIEALVIIGSKEQLSAQSLVAIDQYILSGGNVIFALNRVDVDLTTQQTKLLNTGLETLLAAYRLPISGNLVRDLQANNISVRQQQGPFSFMNQIRYPFIPVVTNFGDNPVTKGLEAVSFQFVSSVDVTLADSTKKITVLASSSENTGTERGTFNIDPFRQWTKNQFPEKNLPLAAMIEGSFNSAFSDADSVDVDLKQSSSSTSIVVIGDADFLVNGAAGQQQQRQPDDNINLLVNAVDYLVDDTGLISLRTKGITNRPLDIIEDGTKTIIKYANVLLPILIVMVYGFLRYQGKQRKRRRWMEQGV